MPAHLISHIEAIANSYRHALGEIGFKSGADYGYRLAMDEQKQLLDEMERDINWVVGGELEPHHLRDIEFMRILLSEIYSRFKSTLEKLKAHRGDGA